MPHKFRFPVKRSPKSDPQQYRVYRMENEAIGSRSYAKLTRASIRAIAHGVCRNYGVPQVNIAWADLGRWAAEWREQPSQPTSVIVFNTKKGTARDVMTVTHELAHHIHYYLGGEASLTHEDHGPQFMACHMSVLDSCRIIPVVGMRAICDAWGVEFTDPGTTNSLSKLKKIVSTFVTEVA